MEGNLPVAFKHIRLLQPAIREQYKHTGSLHLETGFLRSGWKPFCLHPSKPLIKTVPVWYLLKKVINGVVKHLDETKKTTIRVSESELELFDILPEKALAFANVVAEPDLNVGDIFIAF